MRKIPSVFKRDYDTGRLIDEVTPGCEWVLAGEGVATVKWDGTCCLVRDGKLYRRHDRKPRKGRRNDGPPFTAAMAKDAPPNWEPCQDAPDAHTGHWPGWIPVGDGPEDKWYREPFDGPPDLSDGTYELVGPKINGNPGAWPVHCFIPHGAQEAGVDEERDFLHTRVRLASLPHEGIVYHHSDGRMAKVKRRDFGLAWPLEGT